MPRLLDLSHVIEHGMTTYQGLPGPAICDFWSRDYSASLYEDGSSFQIGRIDMVANTGTYLDTPFHRFADGDDLAGVDLARLAALPGLCLAAPAGSAVDAELFENEDVAGKAVLVATNWDRHWRTDAYHRDHPFLTEAAARLLAGRGAALVGIDSYNIDDTRTRRRPVHTILLGAGIPICEHLTGLDRLPRAGFAFTAAPPKVRGMGTFPVRAVAAVED